MNNSGVSSAPLLNPKSQIHLLYGSQAVSTDAPTVIDTTSPSAQIRDLRRLLDKKDQELQKKHGELLQLQKEYQIAAKKNHELAEQLEDSKEDIVTQQKSFEKEKANNPPLPEGFSKYHYDQLKINFETLKQDYASQIKKLETYKTKVATLDGKLNTTNTEVLHLKEQLTQSENRFNDLYYLKNDNEILRKKVDELQLQKITYKNSNIDYEAKLATELELKESLEKINKKLQTEINELNEEKDSTITTLEKKLYDVEIHTTIEASQYHKMYEESLIKVQELESQNSILINQNADILRSLDHNIKIVNEAELEKATLRQTIDQLCDSNDRFQIEKNEYEKNSSKLINKLKTKLEKLEKAYTNLATQFAEYKSLFGNSNVVKTNMFNEIMELRVKIVNLERMVTKEVSLKNEETKKILYADEVNDELQSKIIFFKNQLSNAAKANMHLSEYNHLLNSHIRILYDANLLIRQRLFEQVDEHNEELKVFRFHNLNNNSIDNTNNDNTNMNSSNNNNMNSSNNHNNNTVTNNVNNNANSHRKEQLSWDDKKYQKPDIALLPTSALNLIERSVFDYTSAFLSDENHPSKENVRFEIYTLCYLFILVFVYIYILMFIFDCMYCILFN